MFDEIAYRYRSLSVTYRLLICLLCGGLPGLYSYFNVIQDLELELDTASAHEANERKKLSEAKEKIKNLPAVEEKLAFTRDQLLKAEKRLPSQVLVDEVVKQVGSSGNRANVELKSFTPAGFDVVKGEYSYDEVKYEVIMHGKFSNLAQWLDDMSSSESRAYAKAWKLSKSVTSRAEKMVTGGSQFQAESSPAVKAKPTTSSLDKSLSPVQLAQLDREEFKLDLLVDLVYYRSSLGASDANALKASADVKAPNSHENPSAPESNHAAGAQPAPGGAHAK